MMKLHILILTIFLSGLFGGRTVSDENIQSISTGTVVESTSQDSSDNYLLNKSLGILPSRTAGFSGESSSVAPSFRSTNSGRRVQPSGKAPFRIIKDGKVINRHYFHTFQTVFLKFSSGVHSTNRYIHTLCQLLI